MIFRWQHCGHSRTILTTMLNRIDLSDRFSLIVTVGMLCVVGNAKASSSTTASEATTAASTTPTNITTYTTGTTVAANSAANATSTVPPTTQSASLLPATNAISTVTATTQKASLLPANIVALQQIAQVYNKQQAKQHPNTSGIGLDSSICGNWRSDPCSSNCIACSALPNGTSEISVLVLPAMPKMTPPYSIPFPTAICELKSLVILSINQNYITGSVPDCVGEFQKLERLMLGDNDLNGSFPTALCSITSLEWLYLENNFFTGTLPTCISQLVNLHRLQLGYNQFSGDLHNSAICNLPNVTILHLQANPWTPGPIPGCIANSRNMKRLNLFDSQRQGSIPPELWKLTKLVNLTLTANPGITGNLGTGLCDLVYLQGLYLDGLSGLSGELPTCIYQLQALQQLSMVHTSGMSGIFPPGLLSLHSLRYLVIEKAVLIGGFPAEPSFDCGGPCPKLAYFNPLSEDEVYDEPKALTNGTTLPWLPNIQLLAMVGCKLDGTLPSWFGSVFFRAKAVVLSGNNIHGELPEFPPGTSLEQFHMADNVLTGTLDPLLNADSLTQLDVGHNKITGTVPVWLADRARDNMTTFVVEDNHLSCEIPPQTAIKSDPTSEYPSVFHVLRNNLFSCPIAKEIIHLDTGSIVYKCGSAGLWFGLTVFASVALVVTIFISIIWYITNRVKKDVNMKILMGASGADSKMIATSGAVAFLWGAGLIPSYVTAPSKLTCRFGWTVTAAFLESYEYIRVYWVWGLALFGGIGGGMALTVLLLVPALRYIHEHQLHNLFENTKPLEKMTKKRTAIERRSTMMKVKQVVKKDNIEYFGALGIAFLWVAANTAWNVLYLYIQEHHHEPDAAAKHFVVVLYGASHEATIHLLLPWTIWHTIERFPHKYRTPATVHTMTLCLGLVCSVVAPLVALLIGSEGCLPVLYHLPPVSSTAFVQREYCSAYYYNITDPDLGCATTANVTTPITYTQEFQWDSSRCISSIITLYTPAYVMVLSIRLLLLSCLYWLRNFHPSVLTMGILKRDEVFDAKINANESQEEFEERRRKQEWAAAQYLTWASTYGMNCISIAMCTGMASPVIALLSFICLVARPTIFYVLDRLRVHGSWVYQFRREIYIPATYNPLFSVDDPTDLAASMTPVETEQPSTNFSEHLLRNFYDGDSSDDESEDGDNNDISYASASAHKPKKPKVDPFALPVASIALVLLFQTMYLIVFLYAGGLPWVGVVVGAFNWIVFTAVARGNSTADDDISSVQLH